MSTVSAISAAVKSPNHETVCQWLASMADRGELPPNTARVRASALNQLVTVLAEEEPRDPTWLLANIADIGRRWALKNQARGATTKDYIGKAKTTLTDYLAWLNDPAGFRFKTRDLSPDREPGAPRPKKKVGPRADIPPPPVPTHDEPQGSPDGTEGRPAMGERRTFPLNKDGTIFVFHLPSQGITIAEVRKCAFHLLTLASDFDPMRHNVDVFAMTHRDAGDMHP